MWQVLLCLTIKLGLEWRQDWGIGDNRIRWTLRLWTSVCCHKYSLPHPSKTTIHLYFIDWQEKDWTEFANIFLHSLETQTLKSGKCWRLAVCQVLQSGRMQGARQDRDGSHWDWSDTWHLAHGTWHLASSIIWQDWGGKVTLVNGWWKIDTKTRSSQSETSDNK